MTDDREQANSDDASATHTVGDGAADDRSILRRDLLRTSSALGLTGLAGCADLLGDQAESTPGDEADDAGNGTDARSPQTDAPDLDAEDRILTDTDEIRPGRFTRFDGGLMIGAHPDALEGPVRVDVSWYDPTDEVDPSDLARGQPVVDEFVEIAAVDVDDPAILAPHNTGIFVAVPVPEGFDVDHLEPLEYVHGEVSVHGDDGEYIWTDGVFDPDERLFLVDTESIGSTDYPTRLGVAVHPTRETEQRRPIVEEIVTERFPAIEAQPRLAPEDRALAAEIEPLSDHELAAVNFEVIWRGVGSENSTIVEEVEDALYEAYPVYIGLEHDPRPRLRTKLFSDTYKYYVEGGSSCDTRAGRTVSTTKLAYTCDNASNHARTTRHELFHTIQYDLTFWFGEQWVVEGTARLAENLDLFATRQTPAGNVVDRPVDLDLYVEGDADDPDHVRLAPYRAERFWVDLLVAAGQTDFDHLGQLFWRGLDRVAAKEYIDHDIASVDGLQEAHWHWVRNAAFEGGPDQSDSYTHSCWPNLGAFHDGVRSGAVDPSVPVVVPDETTQTSTIAEIDYADLVALTATMVEVDLPAKDVPHYYDVSASTSVGNLRVYPDTNNCESDTFDADVAVDNDGSPRVVVVRALDEARKAFVLVQSPIPGSGTEVVFEGPYRHSDVAFSTPESPTTHELDTGLSTTLTANVANPSGKVERVDFSFTFDDTPIEPIDTAYDLDGDSIETPSFDRTFAFDFDPEDLCAAVDIDQWGDSELEVTMSLRSGTDPDADVLLTDTDVLEIDPVVPEISLGYDVEHAEWYPATSPIYADVDSVPTTLVLYPLVDPSTGVRLTGRAHACADPESPDVSAGLRWRNHQTGAILSYDRELVLEKPDDFQDENGDTIDLVVRLEHDEYDGDRVVNVQWCEPFCIEPEPLEAEIADRLFDPIGVCPDGSFDPDCFARDVTEFQNRLDAAVGDRLFGRADPGPAFPLGSFGEWPTTGTYTRALLAFAQQVTAVASDSAELADGEFHSFVHDAARMRRDWAGGFTDAEAAVASDFVAALSIALHVFGSPTAGGANALRYVAGGFGVSNPNTAYQQVDLRPIVESTALGVGSALARFAHEPRVVRSRVRTAGAYGFLSGVADEFRRNRLR